MFRLLLVLLILLIVLLLLLMLLLLMLLLLMLLLILLLMLPLLLLRLPMLLLRLPMLPMLLLMLPLLLLTLPMLPMLNEKMFCVEPPTLCESIILKYHNLRPPWRRKRRRMVESEKLVKLCVKCGRPRAENLLSPLEERCEEIRRGRRRRRRLVFQAGQWVATVLAVSGVLFNNARLRWCFPLWVVSNAITLVYHVRARLWGLACRDVVFLVLAAVGWFMWG